MSSYLTRGIVFLFLAANGINVAIAEKADLSFVVIPEINNINTGACHAPVLATYTIIAGTPVPLTLQKIDLERFDLLPKNAVTIVPSAHNSCKQGQQLAKNQTCNITVSFQPCDEGQINRKLIIEINTSQGVLESIISTKVTQPALQVAAGNSANSSGLIVQSQDNGFTWENVTTKVVPHLPEKLNFDNASCNLTNTCIVVGWDQAEPSPPLLVTTLDAGNTWSIVSSVLGSNGEPISWPERGRFDTASCSGNVCIAVGIDFSEGGAPLIFNSLDAGATWYERSITNGPTTAELYGATCNENKLCVITGQSSSSLLASSINGGATWALITTLYDTNNNTVPFPANVFFANGGNPSCSEDLCIAGGNIMAPWSPWDPPSTPVPFLISSTSPGKWVQVTSSLPAHGNLNGFSCSGTHCVTVGGNQSSGNILIVYTKDAGKTWTQVTGLSNTDTLPSGSLDNVSCYDDYCVAGSGTDTGPLLITSQDGGATWKQITSASGGGFPNYGRIFSTGCSANICMAGGGDITNPTYLLTSADGGKTWNNVNSITFPSDGLINTVSIAR